MSPRFLSGSFYWRFLFLDFRSLDVALIIFFAFVMSFFENDAFCALLRMALDSECSPSIFPYKLNDAEWNNLHLECLRQQLVGIVFRAISHLPKNQCPPLGLVFQWASEAETVQTMGCTDCSRTPLACSVPTLHDGLDDFH